MPMNPWIITALLIIAALAAYAGYLHWLLRRKRRDAARFESQAPNGEPASSGAVGTFDPQPHQQRTVMAEKAVYLLAEALLDDKLTHTEGCIRISSMAAGLPDYERFQVEYGVFFQVAEATAHIPILDAWRALSLKEQKAFDRERQAIEDQYSAAVVEAAHQLRERWRNDAGAS